MTPEERGSFSGIEVRGPIIHSLRDQTPPLWDPWYNFLPLVVLRGELRAGESNDLAVIDDAVLWSGVSGFFLVSSVQLQGRQGPS